MPILTHEERIGNLLGGKYRLEKILGRGGMGAVFLGKHEWTGRPVAVKILNGEHVQDSEAAQRFLREARTAAGLKHPNVVDVLDMGEDPGDTVFMVLELLEGESLGRLIEREKPLPFERAAAVLMPVMRAVAHAHARNVVHRDLKPENIFVHRDGSGAVVPKILDFGIAKALDDPNDSKVTRTGFVLGTPAYMSPEQGEGVPENIGPPADVWSMGVVWYEALTGAMPFEGPTPTATLLAVINGKYTRLVRRLPSLPVPVANAIDKALVKDASRRYPDMAAFLDALQRAVEAPPETARESSDRITRTSTEMQLGPVRESDRSSLADAFVMGDANPTEEPVVLLQRRRDGARRTPALAVAAALLACGGVGAWLLLRQGATTQSRDAGASVAATAPAPFATPQTDADAGATVTSADAGDDAPVALDDGRRQRRSRDRAQDREAIRPLAIFYDPPHLVVVTPDATPPSVAPPAPAAPAPTAPVQTAPAPEATPTPARPPAPTYPRENAPMTDYDEHHP